MTTSAGIVERSALAELRGPASIVWIVPSVAMAATAKTLAKTIEIMSWSYRPYSIRDDRWSPTATLV